jgi:biopolymer transport protein ExbD
MASVSVGDSPDNPVAINVTAMVDVIFCLCVFFMCSLHFRQVEGKFETWLPKGQGIGPDGAIGPELRVAMSWDAAGQRTVRQFGQRVIQDDAELQTLIGQSRADWQRLGLADAPLTIDADVRVPWRDVIDVVNLASREAIDRIQFAMGAAPRN